MMRFLLCLIFLGVVSPYAFAQEQALTVDLAEDHIDITTGFTGAHIVMHGVKNVPGDIAVVVRGPERDMSVRKKRNILGAWINRGAVKFTDVPIFYDYALSLVDENAFDVGIRREEMIGLQELALNTDAKNLSEADKKAFKAALIRNKQAEELFSSAPKMISFLSDRFFKVEFYMPSNLPTGAYVVEAFLLQGDRIIDRRVMNLKVEQQGFSAGLDKFAQKYAFFYAILVVVFAMFAGWLSNAVRRKR